MEEMDDSVVMSAIEDGNPDIMLSFAHLYLSSLVKKKAKKAFSAKTFTDLELRLQECLSDADYKNYLLWKKAFRLADDYAKNIMANVNNYKARVYSLKANVEIANNMLLLERLYNLVHKRKDANEQMCEALGDVLSESSADYYAFSMIGDDGVESDVEVRRCGKNLQLILDDIAEDIDWLEENLKAFKQPMEGITKYFKGLGMLEFMPIRLQDIFEDLGGGFLRLAEIPKSLTFEGRGINNYHFPTYNTIKANPREIEKNYLYLKNAVEK